MVSVLMVCLGNICRSPLAEGVLKSKLDLEKFHIDSAGTAAYHIGKSPDARSIAVAKKYGVDIKSQKARLFIKSDFKLFDYIYVMDQSNYKNVLGLADTDMDRSKVRLILEEIAQSENLEVPDPYYGGKQGFEDVYQLLDKSCTVIADKLNV